MTLTSRSAEHSSVCNSKHGEAKRNDNVGAAMLNCETQETQVTVVVFFFFLFVCLHPCFSEWIPNMYTVKDGKL